MSEHPVFLLEAAGMPVRLRDWRLDDLDLYAFWSQPGHRWQDYDGPYFPKPQAEEVAQDVAKLRDRVSAARWPEPRHQMVVADSQTDRLLGTVSRYWLGKETNWLAIGIAIFDPALWGKGRGTAALGLWCDYLWQTMPELVRLDMRTWSGNEGMMRVAEKLGFQLEARFRKARIVNGLYYDGLGYGVLREEWIDGRTGASNPPP